MLQRYIPSQRRKINIKITFTLSFFRVSWLLSPLIWGVVVTSPPATHTRSFPILFIFKLFIFNIIVRTHKKQQTAQIHNFLVLTTTTSKIYTICWHCFCHEKPTNPHNITTHGCDGIFNQFFFFQLFAKWIKIKEKYYPNTFIFYFNWIFSSSLSSNKKYYLVNLLMAVFRSSTELIVFNVFWICIWFLLGDWFVTP